MSGRSVVRFATARASTRRALARASASAIVIIASCGAAREASANGRFPASNGVLFAPQAGGDDATVLVRVTFGLVATRDGGKSWGWICERAIGFSGPEDPTYVITRSGAIVAGLFDGLRVSRDGGCSWDPVVTDASVFVDVTLRADGAVLALASSYDRHGDGGSLYKTQLWISTDDARSFTPLAPRFDPTLLGETVEVAPSDPQRVYVSAVRGDDVGRQAVLLASSDGGKHWTERAAALEPKELAAFIAAVDPKHADRIYLRTSASPENPTRLLVTDDAGKTYRKLLGAKGPLLGFALSADGSRVHAGGPDDGLYAGSAASAGTAGSAESVANAGAQALAPVSKLKVQCLARDGDALWACSSEGGGFVAGVSRDDGASFAPRLHLRDIGGPLACAPGSAVARECGVDWAKLQRELGLGGGPREDAGAGASAVAGAGESADTRDRGAWTAALVAIVGGAVAVWLSRRRRAR